MEAVSTLSRGPGGAVSSPPAPCACPPPIVHPPAQLPPREALGQGQRETSANGPYVFGYGLSLGQLCRAGTLASLAVQGSRPRGGPTATAPQGQAGSPSVPPPSHLLGQIS